MYVNAASRTDNLQIFHCFSGSLIHPLHGSTPQTGIAMCFIGGREGDILGYLGEDNGVSGYVSLVKDYSMVTDYVRCPIRTGQESHTIVDTADVMTRLCHEVSSWEATKKYIGSLNEPSKQRAKWTNEMKNRSN